MGERDWDVGAEAALVRAAQGGDREAFRRLVERYAHAVLMRCYGCAGEMASAEDLAQDTMVRALESIGRLADAAAFGGWLLAIADHACRDWLRRKQTRETHAERLVRPGAAREPGPDPRVASAIAALAPELQQMLALRFERGLSCEEIARELGRPLGSVTKMLSRAYDELRERLETK